MNLHDHFHPPLAGRRRWHSFHSAWATYIAGDLNRRLPAGFFAEPNVQFDVEIDVAAFEEEGGPATQPWRPPAATRVVPFIAAGESVEVLVYGGEGGPTLAAAVELVSPGDKDREEHREAFLSKCEAYLNQGVGLAVVDVVTERRAQLHRALLARLGQPQAEAAGTLYAAAYRVTGGEEGRAIDVWELELAVGAPLQVLPLWLRGAIAVPLDLPGTYEQTCSELRIPVASA